MSILTLPYDVVLNHILPYIGKPTICVSKEWDNFMYPYYIFCNSDKLTPTLFKEFCRKGYTKLVNIIAKLELLDINYSGEPIRLACEAGHTDIVKLLLNTGKVKSNCYNDTLILTAVSKGHTSLVQLLLTYPEVNPSTSYNLAVKKGYDDIIILLLADKRVNPLNVSCTDEMWRNKCYITLTPLM